MPVDMPIPPGSIASLVVTVPDVIQVSKKKEIKAKRLALMDENQRIRQETERLDEFTFDQFL